MYELPAPAEIDLREEVYDVQQGPDSPMHDAVEPVVPVDEASQVLLPVGVRWFKIQFCLLWVMILFFFLHQLMRFSFFPRVWKSTSCTYGG